MEGYENLGPNTIAVHAGVHPHDSKFAVSTPIYQTSTFAFKNADHGAALFAGKEKGHIYTRIGNPTIDALEEAVAALEGGKYAIATSSGMSAICTVYSAFLGAGLHLVSTAAVYGPSRSVIEKDYSRFGVEFTYINTANLDEVEKAIKPNTKLLYIETPANPTMDVTDIAGCRKIADKHGLILVVDNTFASPVLQKPFDFGADIVLHSMTKFINGHGDVVAGMLVAKDEELYKKMLHVMQYYGGNMDPHQAWLVLRGLKTIGIRVEREQENAMKIAEYLAKHPKIEWIKYPGLASHPQKALIDKQMKGPGALMAFGVRGGFEAGKTLLNNVKVATLAVSLGGIETLIQHPASMTHASVPKESREAAGITDGLIRLSVGIENVEDLIKDLEQALAKI